MVLLTFCGLQNFCFGQSQEINNVQIGFDVPAAGVNVKINNAASSYSGGWARMIGFSNENNTINYIHFGAFGSAANGVNTFRFGYIGKAYDDRYMTFLPNGNIGIGAEYPVSNLEIAAFKGGVLTLSTGGKCSVSDTPLNPAIEFVGCDYSKKARITADENTYRTHCSKLSFWVGDSITKSNLKERFTIFGNGNIGIGTTTPQSNLEIASRLGSVLTLSTSKACGSSQSPIKSAINFVGCGELLKANIVATEEGVSSHGTTLSFSVGDNAGNFAERLTIKRENVGIGTTNPTHKLTVNGGILCEEVKVIADVPQADYVFEEDYKLSSLEEVDAFIKINKHLPNIPSAEEFKANGYKVGEMDEMLLRKVEEITLYLIEQNKKIDALEKENKELKEKFNH